MVAVIETKDAKLEKLSEKKKRLENFIDKTVDESKNARRLLEREVEEIKAKIETLNKVEELQPKSNELLEYIGKQIEAKEKELECPVCFEVVSGPPPYFVAKSCTSSASTADQK